MTSKYVIKKIVPFTTRTSFCVGLMALSLLLMGQETINYSFEPFRPFFQTIYDNQVRIIITSALLMMIALNVNLFFTRQESKIRLSSIQKYISISSVSTKAGLERVRLNEK